ncbi:unnamed protein product [Closterium sp. Yama58-4]|nr:unnamed protein product [Closterium sp. Yama58-4]
MCVGEGGGENGNVDSSPLDMGASGGIADEFSRILEIKWADNDTPFDFDPHPSHVGRDDITHDFIMESAASMFHLDDIDNMTRAELESGLEMGRDQQAEAPVVAGELGVAGESGVPGEGGEVGEPGVAGKPGVVVEPGVAGERGVAGEPVLA